MNIKKKAFLVLFLGMVFSLVGVGQTVKAQEFSLNDYVSRVEFTDIDGTVVKKTIAGIPIQAVVDFEIPKKTFLAADETVTYQLPSFVTAMVNEDVMVYNEANQVVGEMIKSYSGDDVIKLQLNMANYLEKQTLHVAFFVRAKEIQTPGALMVPSDAAMVQDLTVEPATPGFFGWRTDALDYSLQTRAAPYFEEDYLLMGNYFRTLLNRDAIKNKNPEYTHPIPDRGVPYFFFGKSSENGVYYPNEIAICIDIFHTLVNGTEYKSELSDYVTDEAAQHIFEIINMGAIRAQQNGMQVLKSTSYQKPIIFDSMATTNGYRQRTYMFTGQLIAWQVAALGNRNENYRLQSLPISDLNPQMRRTTSENFESVDLTSYINELEQMREYFKDWSFWNSLNDMELSTDHSITLTLPSTQNDFEVYLDYDQSENLDYLVQDNLPGKGKPFTTLNLQLNKPLPGDKNVKLAFYKLPKNAWQADVGFDCVASGNRQLKAVYTMPEKYRPATQIQFKQKTIGLEGEKVWNDGQDKARPSEVTVTLLQNGVVFSQTQATMQNNWHYQFTNLPKYDNNGDRYNYTVKEEVVPGYGTSIDGTTITNTKMTDIKGEKTWYDGNSPSRPQAITVYLLQNGNRIDKQVVTAEMNWKYAFSNLPAFDASGKKYEYTVEEDPVPGYETSIDGTTIINTQLIDLAGEKKWFDGDGSNRPKTITINLYRKIKDNSSDANKVDSQVVSADKNWKYSFTNLPKYDSTGAEYEYTIKEEAVPGYETVISDDYQTISNYAFTEVNGEKIWNDKNDELHLRPNSITVELLQDGKSYQEKQITADKDGKWSYAFTDLPMYNKATNELYTYTVNEKEIPEYYLLSISEAVTQNGKTTINLTNTYRPTGVLPETGAGMIKRLLIILGASVTAISLGIAGFYWYQRKTF